MIFLIIQKNQNQVNGVPHKAQEIKAYSLIKTTNSPSAFIAAQHFRQQQDTAKGVGNPHSEIISNGSSFYIPCSALVYAWFYKGDNGLVL